MFGTLTKETFTMQEYMRWLDILGIGATWNLIGKLIVNETVDSLRDTLLNFDTLGELYEIGLAHVNKWDKKDLGKYFTPKDVAKVMADLLLEKPINILVDVATGTGNLIIEVLGRLNEKDVEKAVELIKGRRVYLYDVDKVAIDIALLKIDILFQQRLSGYINTETRDLLRKEVQLPKGCSIISNPPYSTFKEFKYGQEITTIGNESKELYAMFTEKITANSSHAVIVTPQSYLYGNKFRSLREHLHRDYSGEVYCFDNVPQPLFNGAKHGVFNSNKGNSVRAAISSIFPKEKGKGFRLTHLIRFTSEQREQVLELNTLKNMLSGIEQDIRTPLKLHKGQEHIVSVPMPNTLRDLVESNETLFNERYRINVVSTARYYVVGAVTKLSRSGMFSLYAKDRISYLKLYVLLNSSYVYWWYRMRDGGMTLSKNTVLSTPVDLRNIALDTLTKAMIETIMETESQHLTYKKNVGVYQESIKFPDAIRNTLNEIVFNGVETQLEKVHSNKEIFS